MFTDAEWIAIWLSLKVSLVATLLCLPVAFAVAYLLSRFRFRGYALVDALVHMPLVLPPVVTGYVLLMLLGRRGLIGEVLERHFGLVFAFRWTGAAVAAAVMGFPLFVRAIRMSLDAIDQRLEDAAATLGANRFRVFLTVTLPLCWPGLIGGMVLCFAKALGEFGATITFVANIPGETQTLPLAIYNELQVPGEEPAALRLVLISVAIAFGAVFLSHLMRERAKRGGAMP